MNHIFTFNIVITIFSIISLTLSNPTGKNTHQNNPYTGHKNYNLLVPRGSCGIGILEDKITLGEETALDEFPWMAKLRYIENGVDFQFSCSGTLINQRYVLSAAHCLRIADGKNIRQVTEVRLGEHNLLTDPDCDSDGACADKVVDIRVEEIAIHPKYNSVNKHNDIGLIRLTENVIFNFYVKPICLPLNGERSNSGKRLVVAGWGLTEKKVLSTVLQKAEVPVVGLQRCSTIYRAITDIIENQICAGGQDGVDSCKGDSGGPLMSNFAEKNADFFLEGIVSFGNNECGLRSVPAVYTRVSSYIHWILETMKSF